MTSSSETTAELDEGPGERPDGEGRPAAGTRGAGRPAPAEGRKRRWAIRPPVNHKVADLERRHRVVFWVLIGLVVAMPFLSSLIVLLQGWRPAGDNALIGLRVHDVITGHWPLVGQPTTGENFGSGIPTSHPGPIEFYLVAPFVLLFGPAWGLGLGTAAINAAGLGTSAWLAFRRGGMALMVLATVFLLSMSRSLGGNFLHDPVSSQIGTMAALALLFATWSLLAGDLRVAPVWMVAASFTLQDHLAYLGTSAPVVLLGAGGALWWFRRSKGTKGRARMQRVLLWSVVGGLVLWFPVLLDEVVGDGNLGAIFRTFTGKRTPGEGALFAVERLAEALAPWPIFSRRVVPLGYLHTPSTVELVSGYLVLGAFTSMGGLAWWRGRRDLLAATVVGLVVAAAGVYSSVKLPVGAGIQASNLRWMWMVSLFVWLILLWTAFSLLREGARKFLQPPFGALAVVLVAMLLLGLSSTTGLPKDRDGSLIDQVGPLMAQLHRELPKGTYRVTYEGNFVVGSVGPLIVHDLDHRGDTVYLDVGPFTRAYADHRAYEGQDVRGTLLITVERSVPTEGFEILATRVIIDRRDPSKRNTVRVMFQEGRPDG
jgi:hypothetical protein